MDGVGPFLPEEIIRNILKLLPVKSLIRFQCVCNHWKNLIRTPSFIADHLHHSTQHRPSLLFHRYSIRDRLHLYLLDCQMQIVEVQKVRAVYDGRVWIVGSSNGLLCLRINRYLNVPTHLLLWNPAIREVRYVPPFPGFEDGFSLGFGFSPIVNDYKIVSLYNLNYGEQVHFVEVYSLGIGSWKKIEVGNLGGLTLMNNAAFSMNGAMFWLGFKQGIGETGEYVIVSFDIAMEVFTLITAPSVNIHGVHVTEFEHRLALLCSTTVGNDESCLIELWVLEEGTGGSCERCSWAKKYSSSPHSCMLNPVTIWRNEIFSIFHLLPRDVGPEHVERTVMSNFTGTELKVLFDHGNFLYNYVESLVPVSDIHDEES